MGIRGAKIQVPIDLEDPIVLRRAFTDIISGFMGTEESITNLTRVSNTFDSPQYYRDAKLPIEDKEIINKLYADSLISAISQYLVPVGAIMMWSGDIVDIPEAWHLCDGTTGISASNGTILTAPDLRDSFIVGAGTTYPVGDTGGDVDIILTTTSIDTVVGATDVVTDVEYLPEYYALAYIIKI